MQDKIGTTLSPEGREKKEKQIRSKGRLFFCLSLAVLLLGMLVGSSLILGTPKVEAATQGPAPIDQGGSCEFAVGGWCMLAWSDSHYYDAIPKNLSTNDITGVGWKNASLLFFGSVDYTISNVTIKFFSQSLTTLVDIFAGIAIMLTGIRVIIGSSVFRQQNMIEGIPRIVLAVVVAHLSYGLMAIFVEFSMEFSYDVYSFAEHAQNGGPGSELKKTVSYNIKIFDVDGKQNKDNKCEDVGEGNVKDLAAADPDWHIADKELFVLLKKSGWSSDPTIKAQIYAAYHKKKVDLDQKYADLADPGKEDGFSPGWNPLGKTSDEAIREFLNFDPEHRTFEAGKVYFCKNGRIDGNALLQKFYADKLELPSTDDINENMDDLLGMVFQVTAFVLLVQVLMRLFFLNIYLVTSSVSLSAWALPAKLGNPVTRMWLHGFLSLVFVQIIQGMALVLIQILLGKMADFMFLELNGWTPDGAPNADSTLKTITLVNLLHIAFLWFIIRIPGLLNTTPMRSLLEVGQAMSNATMSGLQMLFTAHMSEEIMSYMKIGLALQGISMVAMLKGRGGAGKGMMGMGKMFKGFK